MNTEQKKYMEAIKLNPDSVALYKKLGERNVVKFSTMEMHMWGVNFELLCYIRNVAKRELGDVYGAIGDLTSVVELMEGKASDLLVKSLLQRGILFYTIGEKQKGCLDWSRAGELNPDGKVYGMISRYCKVDLVKEVEKETGLF
ncbi:MAG: hypothetical protein ACKOE6_17145, partial [Flammeovirgaceae bacterium]